MTSATRSNAVVRVVAAAIASFCPPSANAVEARDAAGSSAVRNVPSSRSKVERRAHKRHVEMRCTGKQGTGKQGAEVGVFIMLGKNSP